MKTSHLFRFTNEEQVNTGYFIISSTIIPFTPPYKHNAIAARLLLIFYKVPCLGMSATV